MNKKMELALAEKRNERRIGMSKSHPVAWCGRAKSAGLSSGEDGDANTGNSVRIGRPEPGVPTLWLGTISRSASQVKKIPFLREAGWSGRTKPEKIALTP